MGIRSFLERTQWIRVGVLLLALAGVGVWALVTRHREHAPVSWERAHRVTICPLFAPGTKPESLAAALAEAPSSLESWAAAQHEYWTGASRLPLDYEMLAPMEATAEPPWLPSGDDSWWTRWRETKRFFAYIDAQAARFPPQEPGSSRLWLYVYRGLDRGAWEDRFSVGTERGRLGVVFASDDPKDWPNTLCVIMHETLHTVGATDHRNRDATIAYPSGYADPSKEPLFPQEKAEIMALGIPVSESEELRVESLDEVVMGLWTAREIGWK